MDKKRTVFLTGATGLVGSYLLKILLENGHKVYALARSKEKKAAKDRVIDLLRFWDKGIPEKILKNLTIVEGDITDPNLGITSKKILDVLFSEIEILYHSAALAELRAPLDVIRKINVGGTKNVFDFSLKCKHLIKINHISTAYVVGAIKGIKFDEQMLEVGQEFYNTYEQSKYEAELLVRDYIKKGLNISVFRPSLIMGDSQEGKTNIFRLFYEPIHFFSLGVYDVFPATPQSSQNLINIDTVAKALFFLGDREQKDTYHIVSPESTTVEFLIKLAASSLGFEPPDFIPIERFDFRQWTAAQKSLAEPFIPYFNYTNVFCSQRTQEILRKYNFIYPKINRQNLENIFEYCNKVGFIKKQSV